MFCNEQNNENFSESKQIYWSMATANTSNIQSVHRRFASEKCVDHFNAANIFNAHAFLHGICKQGHRFEVVNSQEESENERFQYLAVCTNFGWFLLSWYFAMCQTFCCSIIQEVSYNYHQRNVRSRVSVPNFQVSRSRLLWQSLGLVSKFEPGLGLGGYALDYITGLKPQATSLGIALIIWPLQPIVFKWRQNSPTIAFGSWSRIDTTWIRCATLGPVLLINRKFDISCKLDISHNLSSLPFGVRCIQEHAEVLPHSPVAREGALVGLAPLKQSSKPPQI